MVKGMAGLVGDNMPQNGNSQQSKISDTIQNLVTDELIRIPKAARIQNSLFSHDNGVIQGSAPGQAKTFQILNLLQKTEGSGRGDFLLEYPGGALQVGVCLPIKGCGYSTVQVTLKDEHGYIPTDFPSSSSSMGSLTRK